MNIPEAMTPTQDHPQHPPTDPADRRQGSVLPGKPDGSRLHAAARWIGFLASLAGIATVFADPLRDLAALAVSVDLHSHLPVIPVISACLVFFRRKTLPGVTACAPGWAAAFFALGAMAWSAASRLPCTSSSSANGHLSLVTLSLLLFVVSSAFLFLGRSLLSRIAFPVAFLLFAVPLPDALRFHAEAHLSSASAATASVMMQAMQLPVEREGSSLHLNDLTLEVGRECSGIRSTLVLCITSVLAGNLFLRRFRSRLILVLLAVPLGILRNACRIAVLGFLCVRHDPGVIDGPLHREGGPVFFAFSLVPLFALLWLLRKLEHRSDRNPRFARSPHPEHSILKTDTRTNTPMESIS